MTHKESEQENLLSLKLQYVRVLADSLTEGLCFIDKNGIVQIWNKSAETIYGVEGPMIIGHPVVNFFPNALIEEVRLTRKAQKDIEHSPGQGAHIIISAMPVYVHGEFVGAVSTERDYKDVIQLGKELEEAQAKVSFLQHEVLKAQGIFSAIIGKSAEFLKQIEIAQQIAPTNTNVMITGASGTGKEIFARGIHELSGREGLFIPINCSAIPSELFESEFFGYQPGAFTGASSKGKAGFFELANGGTLFLDEIGDMPYAVQAKLLRAVQEGQIMRIGGAESINVDVRIISATNRDLKKMMLEERSFREDLFYRLNVLEIAIPPLARRQNDIPLLTDYFIRQFCQKNSLPQKKIHPKALKKFLAYRWPGNVRELMNVVENMVVINRGNTITVEDIPQYILNDIASAVRPVEEYPTDLGAAVRCLESDRIIQALKQCDGNKSKAAKLLNIPRVTLYKKINDYKLNV